MSFIYNNSFTPFDAWDCYYFESTLAIKHTTSQSHPKLVKTTHNKLNPVKNHQPVKPTQNNPQSAKISQNHSKPSKATHNQLKPPITT